MILAGDIGGTKTVLALYSIESGVDGGATREARYRSADYPSLEEIVADFLDAPGVQPAAACFGVAGPVTGQESQITNLPWVISADKIRKVSGIERVILLNDLESIAIAVPHLHRDDYCTLNEGLGEPQGTIAVIAPGTGLGTAFLVWTGHGYKALASEGGHTSFAPGNMQEIELLKYLKRRYQHVSFERICSGGHLPNIYDFFRDNRTYPEPAWLKEALDGTQDRTPVIVQAALERKADICEATLDMFVNILGSAVSNMAITILPRGGIYLGGGIPPRILERLKQPDFLGAIANKGRFSALCATMPVHVIMTPGAALCGAAWHGLAALSG